MSKGELSRVNCLFCLKFSVFVCVSSEAASEQTDSGGAGDDSQPSIITESFTCVIACPAPVHATVTGRHILHLQHPQPPQLHVPTTHKLPQFHTRKLHHIQLHFYSA